MKDDREILTREHISKKLIRDSKITMLRSVVYFVLGALVWELLFFKFPPDKLFTFLKTLVFLGLVVACLFFFVRGALRASWARRGEFEVKEDILTEVKEAKFSIWQMLLSGQIFSRFNYNHIFRFRSGKRFVANCAEHVKTSVNAAAGFSLVGDTFFLVSYINDPQKILWIYSTKIYNYRP